jgi:hypothetical protein
VYSIFRGKIGAVDSHLVHDGRLILLETPADVRRKLSLVRRKRDTTAFGSGASPALTTIIENIISMVELNRPKATQA